MGNAAEFSASAADRFREAARQADDPSTKLLAEGLTFLTDAIRDVDAQLETIEKKLSQRG